MADWNVTSQKSNGWQFLRFLPMAKRPLRSGASWVCPVRLSKGQWPEGLQRLPRKSMQHQPVILRLWRPSAMPSKRKTARKRSRPLPGSSGSPGQPCSSWWTTTSASRASRECPGKHWSLLIVRRVAAAKKCLNLLKKKPCGVVLLDLDETPFSLVEMVTSETGYYLATACGNAPDSTVHFGKERHFANLQVIAVVGADSKKCPLIFLEAGERLNAHTYIKYLQEIVFPWATSMYGKGWWLQHDGATAHTANATQQFLNGHAPGFIPKHAWPLHSPDAAPMDYTVFGHLKSMLSGIQFKSKDQLKAAVVDAWSNLDLSFIQNSCKKFRGKLEQIVANNGGWIE